MDSYIEITWLTSFLVLLHSSMVAFYIAWKPQPFYKLILYSALLPLFACFCFHRYGWVFTILLEGIFFIWIYAYAWKTWLIMIANRLLWNFTCYVLFDGTFHLGIYFVPISTFPWLLWLFLILSGALLFHKWKDALAQRDFIYPIRIFTSKVKLQIKGYLDSGNLLENEGVPVIFVDHKYEAYFQNESIELVVMNTVDATKVIKCHEARIKLHGGGYHKVLVNSEKTLQLPMGCHALLNMKLMIQE